MAASVSTPEDMLKIVTKALWYLDVIHKRPRIDQSITKHTEYWLPPLSKLKVLLAYIASVRPPSMSFFKDVEALYGVAHSASDVLESPAIIAAQAHLLELKTQLTSH